MRRWIVLLAALAVAACDSATGPARPGATADLLGTKLLSIFARYDATFAPLVPAETSFVAVQGQPADFVVRFQGQGDPVLEFTLSSGSLLTYPDGTPIAPGDTVRITIDKDAQGRILFRFSPSGLTFNPLSPATLRVWYTHANPDVNGDGVVNATDALLEVQFGIYKQELLTQPWLSIPSLNLTGAQTVTASVLGFTGFSVGD